MVRRCGHGLLRRELRKELSETRQEQVFGLENREARDRRTERRAVLRAARLHMGRVHVLGVVDLAVGDDDGAAATTPALRLRAHDDDQSVVGGADLVPELITLLGATLEPMDDVEDGT